MDSEIKDIATVFSEALEIASGEEREAYLARACRGDAALRQRIDQLLRDYGRLGNFLEVPPPDLLQSELVMTVPLGGVTLGAMIGPYKLREVLGEGGMGIVYAAEQEQPIRRKVALKIVKPGMDTREVVARFEAERQALALMDHPNIAKVIDAGTTETGRPYFVMELVRGMPITEYCDRCRLPPRERLKLFITVCQAVQHAHQKGIIHRDLKPSNVMVTLHDGTPVPKVIDFGVAKALNQKLSEHTVYTRFAQVIGSPLYMSPEQAEFSGLDIDARSDVYSLGVLLYELLTGQTPFDKETLSKLGYDELRRMIREDEPPRPSHRISTLNAAGRSTVAQQRGLDERQLGRSLRGELDWMVMKALEKDRTRRYGSADALAADVRCYLNDQPVQACPPSLAYRLRKFARRKRSLLSTIAILAVCIPLGAYGVFTLIQGSTPQPVMPPTVGSNEATPEPSTKPLPRARVPGRELPGLVPAPPLLPDIGRWQLVTKKPRGVMRSAVWSPDETRLALAEANHVRIYDMTNLQLLQVLVGHSQPVTSVAWHPDGARLASASEDGTVRLWTSDGVPTHLLSGHLGPVYQVAWRPDGHQCASAAADGTVRLWNAEGQLVHTFDEAGRHVFGIDWNADGKLLASVGGDVFPKAENGPSGDNSVRIWDVESAILIRKLDGSVKHSALCVDWRPDGKQLAVGYGDVYRSTHWVTKPLPDAGVRLWNIDGTPGPEIGREFGSVSAVAWHPDKQQLAFGGRGGFVHLWKAADQSVTDTQSGHKIDLNSISWSSDGFKLLTTCRESVREWDGDKTTFSIVDGLSGRFKFSTTKWSSDGKTVSGNGTRFWTPEGQPVPEPAQPADNTPPWWNRDTPARRPDGTAGPTLEGTRPKIDSTYWKWAWNQHGWLAGATWHDAAVRIWDEQGKLIATLTGHRGGVESVSWSPAGDQLVSGGGDSVRLWKSDGTPGPVMTGHTDEVYSVAWSPDGEWIASGGTDSTIRLWKPDGSAGPVLQGHQGGIMHLAWSPDSRKLASGSWLDGTLRVWDIATGKTEWQALLLDTNRAVTLSDAGDVLHGDRELLESGLLYLVEQRDAAMEILSFADFRKRFSKLLDQSLSQRFERALYAVDFDRAEAVFAESRLLLPYADPSRRHEIADRAAQLGRAYFFQGDNARAKRASMAAIELQERNVAEEPDNPDLLHQLILHFNDLGWFLGAAGRNAESVSAFGKAVDLARKQVDNKANDEKFRPRLCRAYLDRALHQPQQADAFHDLALMLETDPKHNAFAWCVVRRLDRLVQADDPGGPADAALEIQVRNVKSLFLEAIRRSPELPRPNFVGDWLATAPERFRDPGLALRLARQAVELNPNDTMDLQSLGWALYQNHDAQGCLEALKQSNTGSESDFFLALSQWKLGHEQEARTVFDAGIKWLNGYVKGCYETEWKRHMITHPSPAIIKRMQAEAAEALGISVNPENSVNVPLELSGGKP